MDALIYCTESFWNRSHRRIESWAEDHGLPIAGIVYRPLGNRLDGFRECIEYAADKGWKLLVYCPPSILSAEVLKLFRKISFVFPDKPEITAKNLPALIRRAEQDPGRGRRFRRGWDYEGEKRRKHLVKAREAAVAARRERAREVLGKVVVVSLGLRNRGISYQRIADELNSRGYVTSQGKSFTPMTVLRALKRYSDEKTNHDL